MKPYINKANFLNALQYVDENFFSKPYSITPMVSRWFNQLAMIQLANGKMLHLTGEFAMEHVDIILDGEIIPKEDIKLIMEFYDQRRGLNEKIEKLEDKLKNEKGSNKFEELAQLKKFKAELSIFDENEIKTKSLYEKVVASGKSSLNIESLEKAERSKINKIVYRPNHGLHHSARTAYLVTTLHAYAIKNGLENKNLTNTELEKLQLMMLFSVVGRKDETGFNDDALDRKIYKGFRATSGKEFLKYCKSNCMNLYEHDIDALYRDAIVVELMGYDDVLKASIVPEVFIDYVIEKEANKGKNIDRVKTRALLDLDKYSMKTLFQNDNLILANAKLDI